MPPTKVMLIRHAEKPPKPPLTPPPFGVTEAGVADGHSLIPRGWQRAGALVAFFLAPPPAKSILTPATIYASAVGGPALDDDGEDISKSLRPQETVTPLSRKLGVPLNTGFTVGQETALAADIRTRDGVVLVAWEHKHIPQIAQALSAAAPGAWPGGTRFDLVWVLDRAPDESFGFTQENQSLLDGDA